MNIRFSKKQKSSWRRKALLPLVCFLVCLMSFNVPFVFANIAGNFSFEEALGNGSGGNWDDTHGAIHTTPGDGVYPGGFANPPNGVFALRLPGTSGDYTFQTYDNVKAGDIVSFSALAMSNVTAGAHQMKIEFKRKNSDGTDDPTPIQVIPAQGPACTATTCVDSVSAPVGAVFTAFNVTGVAPEGTGRVAFVFHRYWAGG